jgi:hypothetical protein
MIANHARDRAKRFGMGIKHTGKRVLTFPTNWTRNWVNLSIHYKYPLGLFPLLKGPPFNVMTLVKFSSLFKIILNFNI